MTSLIISFLIIIFSSANSNAVIYEANVGDDGKLNQEKPVRCYWIMYEHNPVDEEGLTMIERNSAYGMSTKPVVGKPGEHQLTIAPLKGKKTIIVSQDSEGVLHCKTEIGGEEGAEIKSVYVKAKSSWIGLPKVDFVEIKGAKADGSAAYEKMKP